MLQNDSRMVLFAVLRAGRTLWAEFRSSSSAKSLWSMQLKRAFGLRRETLEDAKTYEASVDSVPLAPRHISEINHAACNSIESAEVLSMRRCAHAC